GVSFSGSGFATTSCDSQLAIGRSGGRVVGHGLVHVAGQVGLGDIDQRTERLRVVDSQFREHRPVDLDTAATQPLDEPVVGEVVLPSGSVDPGDPQAPEVSLADTSVTVGVDQRVGDLLLRLAVETGPLTTVA